MRLTPLAILLLGAVTAAAAPKQTWQATFATNAPGTGSATATLVFKTIPAKTAAQPPLRVKGRFTCVDGTAPCVVRKAPLRGDGGPSELVPGQGFAFTVRAKRGAIACQFSTAFHEPGEEFAGVSGIYRCQGPGGVERDAGDVAFQRLR